MNFRYFVYFLKRLDDFNGVDFLLNQVRKMEIIHFRKQKEPHPYVYHCTIHSTLDLINILNHASLYYVNSNADYCRAMKDLLPWKQNSMQLWCYIAIVSCSHGLHNFQTIVVHLPEKGMESKEVLLRIVDKKKIKKKTGLIYVRFRKCHLYMNMKKKKREVRWDEKWLG